MMRRAIALTGLGMLALLAGLAWHLPAAQLLARLPAAQQVQIYGLDGRAVDGSLLELRHGRFSAGPLRWRLAPGSLLRLAPAAQVELDAPVLARGRVRMHPDGTLSLEHWKATATVGELAAAAGQRFVPLDGTAGLVLDRARFADGRPQQLNGRLVLQELVWAMGSQRLPVGTIEAMLRTEDGGQTAQIRDRDARLEIDGRATLLPDGRWTVQLRLRPRPEADPRLVNLLAALGQPDSQGWRHLRQQGRLPW